MPFLSIIIPAHDEENRLPHSLEQVALFVEAQSYSIEVLIIENGSQDHTYEIAKTFASRYPYIKVHQEKERGKGRAVKRGMLEAKGKYRFMCDADLSMPIEEVNRFLPPNMTDVDVAIASREAPGAIRYNEPPYRHLGGRGVNWMIRLLALPGLNDTQCGFKCFRAEVAEDLFHYQTMNGWSFDVEVLYIARLRKYKIVEIPIPWYYNSESKVHAIRDAVRMGLEILTIRRNARQGYYQHSSLTQPTQPVGH
jgi:dolichyl-phosphate beta-glucosyltransferase